MGTEPVYAFATAPGYVTPCKCLVGFDACGYIIVQIYISSMDISTNHPKRQPYGVDRSTIRVELPILMTNSGYFHWKDLRNAPLVKDKDLIEATGRNGNCPRHT